MYTYSQIARYIALCTLQPMLVVEINVETEVKVERYWDLLLDYNFER